MNILADASLPGLIEAFPPPFKLTLYHHLNDVSTHLAGQDILVCRSTLKVTKELLSGHSLRYVATASSGTDHIDELFLKDKKIQLFDAKGSNAHAVADYVLASVAYLQTYHGVTGQNAGIIGLGAVGSKVAARLRALNFKITAYDPPKSQRDNTFQSASLKELAQCDLICIHANLHDDLPYPSRNLIAEPILSQLKPNTAIINASRGGIVNEEALLKLATPIFYCADVFSHEPTINPDIVNFACLCTPHIAGHTIEAKYNAVILISQKIHHSLNLPEPTYAALPVAQSSNYHSSQRWQDYILSLFNPVNETKSLKTALDKTESFLQLRKAHQYRHDFRAQQAPEDAFLKALLGLP
ncbi:erythronate-4-phosphate dehydrogenase [Legionella beliardensis]|uniref:Erythronate-4-phosphate dehydrogenase n=1 Tax=Legionella beliardensis TaxID=91822 RepID=A0A378I716_9GAMM|nr:NAD(P)-dependent oxidoreductase [Legionella beliardensis]STX28234.1 erythronate-4-phosphate dehydrogenase [Legionella beliardensis]